MALSCPGPLLAVPDVKYKFVSAQLTAKSMSVDECPCMVHTYSVKAPQKYI